MLQMVTSPMWRGCPWFRQQMPLQGKRSPLAGTWWSSQVWILALRSRKRGVCCLTFPLDTQRRSEKRRQTRRDRQKRIRLAQRVRRQA